MRPMRMDPSSLPAIQHQVSYLIAGNGDTSVHFRATPCSFQLVTRALSRRAINDIAEKKRSHHVWVGTMHAHLPMILVHFSPLLNPMSFSTNLQCLPDSLRKSSRTRAFLARMWREEPLAAWLASEPGLPALSFRRFINTNVERV